MGKRATRQSLLRTRDPTNYVVVEELIPEAQRECSTPHSTFGAMLGFVLMMLLEVALS